MNMDSSTGTIRGAVGHGILKKVDRLFKNDNNGIWIEVIQNARRAGATLIEITIDDAEPGTGSCVVTVKDNGGGVKDFQDLLTLGESGWDSATQAVEDPAGMGFFALCHSGIEVHSGDRSVVIRPEVFLGTAEAQVVKTNTSVAGTLLKFTRASTKDGLIAALCAVTQFCPVEVRLHGEPLPRHDFLDGALYREVIDGIEIGFGTSFTYASNLSMYNDNWNFHGATIRDTFVCFDGLIDPSKPEEEPRTLFARFNVLETGRVKLQLPDRRAIVQNESLMGLYRKARTAAYRFFQTQPQHALAHKNWIEARELGVALPEASYLLSTWHAPPHDDSIDPVFGPPQRKLLTDLSDVMLVAGNLSNQHTFEASLECGAKLPKSLWAEDSRLTGYSWYDKLPRLVDCEVFLDDVSYASCQTQTRPLKIELRVTITEFGQTDLEISLPACIHVDSEDEYNNAIFVATRDSPWDNDSLRGPFDVVEFLMWATFMASDDSDADSWQTQRDDYDRAVTRLVNEYFRGPKASLVAILRDLFDWESRRLADELKVTEVRFKKNVTGSGGWEIELASPATETRGGMDENEVPA